ncbi:GyrI-like domain-containing protein [Asticcacaulis sp.]|uniref:GyrI-like domain-containing protein n=1 Tax=Asticcacaulis sp. TaxID=1872648 RepID=UPI002BAE0C16|nr:GyrI-like domain-containing protein [Asticcacaulis sp.]HTM79609.1 GyrI-like domain-containing protein [Asticcacaulis sp.]
MIDAPDILDFPAQKVARIHLTVPSNEIMAHMTAGIAEVRQALADQGLKPTGAWLTHHFKVPDQTFDFEICLPVDQDVKPQGRVTPGELRATRTARTVYHGDYAGLGNGWGEFMNWIKAENLTMAGDFWEVYSLGPDDSTNPADWRTQLNCPLA